jgi:putative methionine-R-sulfoxide reductase with GAF domain
MNLATTGLTIAERTEDLLRRYRAATEDVTRILKLTPQPDLTARMRAVADAVWTHLSQVGVSWVGFYLPHQSDEGLQLVLGPSRNKPACSPIGLHGVCGQAFQGRLVRIVHDVRDLGPDYVACDPRDRSEIVLPVFAPGSRECLGVLDLDSHEVGRFAQLDCEGLTGVLRAAGFTTTG